MHRAGPAQPGGITRFARPVRPTLGRGCPRHGQHVTPLDAATLSYILYVMSERLNARIDEELARKLTALQRRLGLTTTEIVRRSIEQMYEQAFSEGESPAAAIMAAGLIGCASGPPDLSTSYKGELAPSLRSKV